MTISNTQVGHCHCGPYGPPDNTGPQYSCYPMVMPTSLLDYEVMATPKPINLFEMVPKRKPKDVYLENAKRNGLLIKPNETFGVRLTDLRGFKVTARLLPKRKRPYVKPVLRKKRITKARR
jgi:hypothetical protein